MIAARSLLFGAAVAALLSVPVLSQPTPIPGGGSSSGEPTGPAGGDLTGDYPNPALATVNADPGTYGDAATCIDGLTVNAKGLITAIDETACDAGAGDITAVTAGAGLTGGGTTGAVTISASALINAQTGTSYTIDATDAAKLVTFSNGSAIAVTVPQATSTFGAGFSFGVQNKGAGTATLTPTTSTINGGASLAIAQNRGCWITSDGTNWQVDSCTALVSGGSVAVGDITGLGSNVGTWLATPSSANLISALTDETGTGAAVFANTPTLVTPVLGVATGTTLALGGCTIGSSSLCTSGTITSGLGFTAAGSGNLTFSGRGILTSIGANNLNVGPVPSGSPSAQTLGAQNASGTNTNAAATFTIVGPLATGTGTPGDLKLATGVAVGSGSSGSTITDAVIIKGETGIVQLPRLSTDATLTTRTVCQNTATNGLHFGSGTAGICLGTSSARYKHDIVSLSMGLGAIMALKPVAYRLNADKGDPNKTLYGFLAEDMAKVTPHLVGYDKQGRPDTADYVGVIPILVNAVQSIGWAIGLLIFWNVLLTSGFLYLARRKAA